MYEQSVQNKDGYVIMTIMMVKIFCILKDGTY